MPNVPWGLTKKWTSNQHWFWVKEPISIYHWRFQIGCLSSRLLGHTPTDSDDRSKTQCAPWPWPWTDPILSLANGMVMMVSCWRMDPSRPTWSPEHFHIAMIHKTQQNGIEHVYVFQCGIFDIWWYMFVFSYFMMVHDGIWCSIFRCITPKRPGRFMSNYPIVQFLGPWRTQREYIPQQRLTADQSHGQEIRPGQLVVKVGVNTASLVNV